MSWCPPPFAPLAGKGASSSLVSFSRHASTLGCVTNRTLMPLSRCAQTICWAISKPLRPLVEANDSLKSTMAWGVGISRRPLIPLSCSSNLPRSMLVSSSRLKRVRRPSTRRARNCLPEERTRLHHQLRGAHAWQESGLVTPIGARDHYQQRPPASLVMGAYRLGDTLEWIFAGVTRQVLDHSRLPVPPMY